MAIKIILLFTTLILELVVLTQLSKLFKSEKETLLQINVG